MALVDLYKRSLFKDLPANISKLSSRHPRNPSERPLKHKEKHSEFDNIDKRHYEGIGNQSSIISIGGSFSITGNNYNPFDVLTSPRDSLHLNLKGNQNIKSGIIIGDSRKYSIFQDPLNITNPLTHETLISNSGLFKIENYSPTNTDNLTDQLHGTGDVLKRRSEIEKRYFERQGFHLPDSDKIISAANPGSKIILPLAKSLVNFGDSSKGSFDYNKGVFSIGQKTGNIYGRTGLLQKVVDHVVGPGIFFETSLQGTPSGPTSKFARSARDIVRIGKFLTTSKGLQFAGKQVLLQTFNPTLETKLWNPLSLINPNLGLLGNTYTERHLDTGLGSKILNAIPGVTSPFPDARTYEDALSKTKEKSRIVFQSYAKKDDGFDDPTALDERQDFFDKASIKLKDNFRDHDPNKFKWPFGSDGAGLPFSSRPSPKEQATQNEGLIDIGAKFTKNIGFSPHNTNQNSLTSLLPSALSAIPGVSQINSIAGILGFGNKNSTLTSETFFTNQYNPSYQYTFGNKIRSSPVQKETPINIAEQGKQFERGNSPLVNVLNAVASAHTTTFSATKPAYTFLRKGELKRELGIDGQFTEAPESDDSGKSQAQEDRKIKLDSYLQTYGEIGKKYESFKQGAVEEGRRAPTELAPGRIIHYEAFKERSRDSTMRVNLGFAGKNSEYTPEKVGIDRINKLDVGEKPEDIAPHLEELIPFRFFHINEKRWIVFRAYLTGITENNNANWNEKRYIGRADPVYTYIGATRKLNFNFDVHPESVRELAPLWKKINAVVALCWPTYLDLPRGDGEAMGQYMVGPFVSLTIGDMYNQVPGIVNSVTVVADDTGTWEDRRGKVKLGKEEYPVAQLPKYIKITVDFTIIGKELFDSKANFFDFNEGFKDNNQFGFATQTGREMSVVTQPDDFNEGAPKTDLGEIPPSRVIF